MGWLSVTQWLFLVTANKIIIDTGGADVALREDVCQASSAAQWVTIV